MKASTITFLQGVNSGTFNTQKAKIYRFLQRNHNATKNYIIKELRMSHQTVTARLSDLLDLGVVEVAGTKKTDISTLSQFRVVVDPERIESNRKNREFEKVKTLQKKVKSVCENLGISEKDFMNIQNVA